MVVLGREDFLLLGGFMNQDKYLLLIPLLEEGTEVYRIAEGEKISDLVFEVLMPDVYKSNSEIWEFAPGTTVICVEDIRDGIVYYRAIEEYKAKIKD
jgi:hypothetical protein